MNLNTYFGILVVFFIFSCGCAGSDLESKSSTLDVTATQGPNGEIIIQYNGGEDAAGLSGLNLEIYTSDGRTFNQVLGNPKIGSTFQFSGWGTPGKDYIKINANIRNKGMQTVLATRI
jgi:hypothetical protein